MPHKYLIPQCLYSVCWSNWEQSYEHTVHYYPRHNHSILLYSRIVASLQLHSVLCVLFLTVRITCAGDCEGHAARGTPRCILVRITACEWWEGRAVAPISGVFFISFLFLFYFFSFFIFIFIYIFFSLLFFVLSPVSSCINYTYGIDPRYVHNKRQMNFEMSSGDEVIIRPSVWNAEYCILRISVYILDNRFLYTKYFILWNTTIVPVPYSSNKEAKWPQHSPNCPQTARLEAGGVPRDQPVISEFSLAHPGPCPTTI